MSVPNVLATRYASAELATLWSPEQKVKLERRLWLAVLRAQRDLGIEVPDGVVEAYERVLDQVDLASIAEREKVTRHDVKARIEEFNALAGHEHVHKGMTSRDLTENVEQLQIRLSLELMRDRTVAVLARLGKLAAEYETSVMAGRSHNVAAQATTLGKRFATAADELLVGLAGSRSCSPATRCAASRARSAPRRTCSTCSAATRTSSPSWSSGSPATSASPGVHQRRPGLPALARLRRRDRAGAARRGALVAGEDDPADGRPRAGDRGLQPGQVGSSAMPHKMNTRSCERVNGLMVILRGYASMMGELAGDQWNEGDVSCSVVRRVALPDAFFAFDGLLETFLTVLDEFGAFPAVIARELDRYLPFLGDHQGADGRRAGGVGREVAHEAIKEDAVGVALAMRAGPSATSCWTSSPPTSASGWTARRARRADGGAALLHRRRASRRRRRSAAGSRRSSERHPEAAAYAPAASSDRPPGRGPSTSGSRGACRACPSASTPSARPAGSASRLGAQRARRLGRRLTSRASPTPSTRWWSGAAGAGGSRVTNVAVREGADTGATRLRRPLLTGRAAPRVRGTRGLRLGRSERMEHMRSRYAVALCSARCWCSRRPAAAAATAARQADPERDHVVCAGGGGPARGLPDREVPLVDGEIGEVLENEGLAASW